MSSEESGSADAAIDGAPVSRARGSGRRTAEHRKRQVEAGLVRIEGWVPQPLRKTAQDYLADLGRAGAGDTDRIEPASRRPVDASAAADPGPQPAEEPVPACAAQLRPLRHRTICGRAPRENEKVALIVDAASRPSQPDDIHEVAMIAVGYDGGTIGDLLWTFSAHREPGGLIELLAPAALNALVEQSVIVIGHDAKAVRPLCESLLPGFADAHWACSASEIPWASVGARSGDLDDLLLWGNWLPSGSRSIDTCHAILELLAASFADPARTGLSTLLANARTRQIRFWVDDLATTLPEVLTEHGYRPVEGTELPERWWKDVPKAEEGGELARLRQIYGSGFEPRREEIGARHRFRVPR